MPSRRAVDMGLPAAVAALRTPPARFSLTAISDQIVTGLKPRNWNSIIKTAHPASVTPIAAHAFR
jgi:hypothetical protein